MYSEKYNKMYDFVYKMLVEHNYDITVANAYCIGVISSTIESKFLDSSDAVKIVEIDATLAALKDYIENL